MIVVMKEGAAEEEIGSVIQRLTEMGFDAHRSTGVTQTVIGVVGKNVAELDSNKLEELPGVKQVQRITAPYKLAGRQFRPENTVIRIGEVEFGAQPVIMMAGPCAVENADQIEVIAAFLKSREVRVLRGGAFKPRTSPYSFQGMGLEGLKILRAAADRHKMLVISEVLDAADIKQALRYVDILQIGARNMQNFSLLKALGRERKPVLLKRGPSATVEETLLAAEYVMAGGNHQVMLCERGIATFEKGTRNTFDVSAIPLLKSFSHLPVIADPSHATGKRDLVPPMAAAAVACGADGLLIEVHHDPANALCDGAQSLLPEQFQQMSAQLRLIAGAVGRILL